MLGDKVRMLGILIQKHMMDFRCQTAQEAIFSIRQAILHCDFDVVSVERLVSIRRALRQLDNGNKVCEFVQQRGEAALWQVEYAELHQLVWQLSTIPQISERLDCMLFQISFPENLAACISSLNTLRKAMGMLNMKRKRIQHFFLTAHRLGQALNRGSSAQQAIEGFQLSALEKLAQTKSTTHQKFSVLHFVLALMSKSDPGPLFDDQEMALLQHAKILRTHKVFQDVVDLVQGMYGARNVCEIGQYTCPETRTTVKIERRRTSLPAKAHAMAARSPSQAASPDGEALVDSNDRFFEVLRAFVEENLTEVESIAEGAFQVMLTYKELAVYFGDLQSVYPPPKSDKDPKKDLCEIFCNFAQDVRKIREEGELETLLEKIQRASEPVPET